MARLHEYEGKAILRSAGLRTPRGHVARSGDEVESAARDLGGACVVKIQSWTTGRKAIGGVAIVDSPARARGEGERMLAMKIGQFPVDRLLVEELIDIEREMFVSLFLDDARRGPAILLSTQGGSGIEDRAGQVHRLACDVSTGVDEDALSAALNGQGLADTVREAVASAIRGVFAVARENEARSLEINPLAITRSGEVVAADCRMTIDDYAVFRHPDLGIDIARELDHPPTELEKLAYEVEQADHRGTFYFAQLNAQAEAESHGLVGFHGAGGGGSMMSMDAITSAGFTIANFCDTSGNPSAAKVYRAARIILSQPGLCGYFGSGSGVASQEQFWSAYGLAKAFWELDLDIPAVVRLGGNSEDRAVEILASVSSLVPADIEGYKKDDAPRFIADRFSRLVAGAARGLWKPRRARMPDFVASASAFCFDISGGRVWIDTRGFEDSKDTVLANASGLLRDDNGTPALAVSHDEIAGKDSELIACEVECRRAGVPAVFVQLDIPGLE